MKKLISVLLTLVFIIPLVTVFVSAKPQYSGVGPDGFEWSYTDGVLTMSGKGRMADYWENETLWDLGRQDSYFIRNNTHTLILEEGIESVGEWAFSKMEYLKTIKFPSTLTEIESSAFAGCVSIEEMYIQDSITAIGDGAFIGCTGLKRLRINKNIENIGTYTFEGCSALEMIEVDAENPKYYSENNCLIEKESGRLIAGTNEGNIPDDGRVKSVGPYAFENRNKLEELVIPEGVEELGWCAFLGCTNLATIWLPHSISVLENVIPFEGLENVYYYGTEEEWNTLLASNGIPASFFDSRNVYFVSHIQLGDANGDGDVDMKDVLLMRKNIAGIEEIPENAEKNADLNEDGDIDMKDVLRLRRIIAGLEW